MTIRDDRVIHLGDGAYASEHGPDCIAITANHHDPDQTLEVVWLDSAAVQALVEWLARRGIVAGRPA